MPLIDRGYYQERGPARPDTAAMPVISSRARLSVDTEAQTFGALLTSAVTAGMTADEVWSAEGLDSRALSRMSPHRMIELLADLSPEVSKAVWDFLRMCNPGFEAFAMRPSGKVKAGGAHQKALDDFLAVLKHRYGSVDVIISRLFIGGWMRGGLMAELVLDQSGRTPLDIATPDPASARWRQREDPDLGVVWQLGQHQHGAFVPLDALTVRYVPIDPFPGRPDGRAIAMPSLFGAVFLLAMLHDIRRVVQQQGWPRLDIAVDLEKIAMPPAVRADPAAFTEWVNGTIAQVVSVYESLQPDDAYTHASFISVNRPVGAVDASSLGAVDGLIAALERMLIRALKTIPLMFGITDNAGDANATRQWEIYVAGIKAIQHLCESLLEHMCTLALRVQGIPALVQWRFAELRAAEMVRDTQVEGLKIQNEREKFAAGWTSQDEASMAITGHLADQAAPRDASGGAPGVGALEGSDPGAMQ